MKLRQLPSRMDERLTHRRINREPSPLLATFGPWLSVMLLSMMTFSPVIASATVLPPLSFMVLICWRMLRPGMLPVWAGAPLGAFDDLYSGQPFGSAILLWSVTMLAMDIIDSRFRYRGFLQDWLVAACLFAGYIVLTTLIASAAGGTAPLHTVLPQMVLAVLLYPAVTGMVALMDKVRLVPLRKIGQ